jgi:hypothetical protein
MKPFTNAQCERIISAQNRIKSDVCIHLGTPHVENMTHQKILILCFPERGKY